MHIAAAVEAPVVQQLKQLSPELTQQSS